MKGLRGITTTVTLVALGSAAAAPVSAQANSLLSGYGGPGQGNQAILGAALLNGPPSGGSGGGGGGGQPAAAAQAGTGAPAAGGGAGGPTRRSGGRPAAASGAERRAGGAAAALSARTPVLPTAAEEAAVRAPALGVSGADLLYILGGLGVLVLTATLTRGLVRRQR
jgi:hypothetical protein